MLCRELHTMIRPMQKQPPASGTKRWKVSRKSKQSQVKQEDQPTAPLVHAKVTAQARMSVPPKLLQVSWLLSSSCEV